MTYTPDTASLTVWGAMTGNPITLAQLPTLIDFSNSQFAYAEHVGLNPFLYVYETLGAALAGEPNFLRFANINGDTAFVTASLQYTSTLFAIHGPEGPPQIQSFVSQLHFLEGFYSAAHLPDYELVAKGAVFGLMLGVENALNSIIPIVGTSMHV